MEIIDIQEHIKGGSILTIRDGKKTFEVLRTGHLDFYYWPSIVSVGARECIELRNRLEEYQLRLKYNPTPVKTYKPKAKGSPNRCMFCRTKWED